MSAPTGQGRVEEVEKTAKSLVVGQLELMVAVAEMRRDLAELVTIVGDSFVLSSFQRERLDPIIARINDHAAALEALREVAHELLDETQV